MREVIRVDTAPMLNPSIVSQFEEALLSDGLRELALKFAADGLRQVEIYCLFTEFCDYVVNLGRNRDSELVDAALEMIVGCCATKWFDHYLLNYEIYAFESGIAEVHIEKMFDIIQGISRSRCWIPHRFVKQSEHLVEVTVMVLEGGSFARNFKVGFERVGDNWRLNASPDCW